MKRCGVTFSCNGDVDNIGKNITLYIGTNVNFANGVKWNIEGGEFKCGLYTESSDELKFNIKSQSGVFRKDLNFTAYSEIAFLL